MRRAVTIIVGVTLVSLVAYLSWLNPTRVDFRWSPTHTVHDAPLAALMVFALVAGAVPVLAVVMVQAGRRAITAWRQDRQQRRVERIDEWEEHGEQLVWNGDAQLGRALLHKAWQRRPESAHALLALAASYQDTGELDRARRLLIEAAEQHHTNPSVLLALAESHRTAGDRAACVEVLERVRALHPHAPRALRALRAGYIDAGRWREATSVQEALLGELRDAQQTERERNFLTVLRYQASRDLADVTARTQALETLADTRFPAVPVLVGLGDALSAGGRADEASAVWERALRTTPRTVLVERLAAIATEGRHRDRLRTLLRKLHPDQVVADNVHVITAQLYLQDGGVDDAARELSAVQHPDDAPALLHRLWADVYRRRGDHERALASYARSVGGASSYCCTACRCITNEWIGYCSQCGGWDSYRAAVEIAAD